MLVPVFPSFTAEEQCVWSSVQSQMLTLAVPILSLYRDLNRYEDQNSDNGLPDSTLLGCRDYSRHSLVHRTPLSTTQFTQLHRQRISRTITYVQRMG